MKTFYLSEDDAVILKAVIQEYRRRDRTLEESSLTTSRHPYAIEEMQGYPSDDIFTPEVYVAEIPEDGIPALTMDGASYIPGSAECIVYKLWPRVAEADNEIVKTRLEFSHLVYNISDNQVVRASTSKFRLIHRDKYGNWIIDSAGTSLVELCSLEDAERNTPYQAKLGIWDPDSWIWCYDDAETVYAIDHRMGPPLAEEGWKGLYQPMPSIYPYHNGRIFVCVSLDCELPPEGCNLCNTGTGS